MQPDGLLAIVQGGAGALVTLAFFVVAFIKGWIVPKPAYDELLQDRDYWRSVADRALTNVEKFVPHVTPSQKT